MDRILRCSESIWPPPTAATTIVAADAAGGGVGESDRNNGWMWASFVLSDGLIVLALFGNSVMLLAGL